MTLTSFRNTDPSESLKNKYFTNEHDSLKQFADISGHLCNQLQAAQHFELNPHVSEFVSSFLAKESYDLGKMKEWCTPYFSVYEKILTENGLPPQLKYLSVIESNLNLKLVSSAGAVGPWQLMNDEAHSFGLKVSGKYDERSNLKKSTEVAAQILKKLYSRFGDWLLVIAAYNAGAGCVNRAISKCGSANYWDLQSYLPQETRKHVKKYIATHYFFEGTGGWTTLTAQESHEKKALLASIQTKIDSSLAAATNIRTSEIIGKYNSVVMAAQLEIDLQRFNELNPLFDKILSEGRFYILRLPSEKLKLFNNRKQEILRESVQFVLSSAALS